MPQDQNLPQEDSGLLHSVRGIGIPDRLQRALNDEPLPGPAAQYRLAPEGRPGQEASFAPPTNAREAAVLIAIYPHNEVLHVPMILRQVEAGPHSGQISFPGGAREPLDLSLTYAALRETYEEIGLPEGDVRVLGALSPLYVSPSNFMVHPFVGWSARRPAFRPDPREVAQILEFRINDFLDTGNLRIEYRELHGRQVRVPHFRIEEKTIWGASAMIWSEFLEILQRI